MLQGSELMELGASPLVEQPKQECGIFHKKIFHILIPCTWKTAWHIGLTHSLAAANLQTITRLSIPQEFASYSMRLLATVIPLYEHVWLRKKLLCSSKCRILSNMTFWPQMSQYQGLLKKMAYFSVNCHFVYMSWRSISMEEHLYSRFPKFTRSPRFTKVSQVPKLTIFPKIPLHVPKY